MCSSFHLEDWFPGCSESYPLSLCTLFFGGIYQSQVSLGQPESVRFVELTWVNREVVRLLQEFGQS